MFSIITPIPRFHSVFISPSHASSAQRVGSVNNVSSRAEKLLQKTLSWAEVNHRDLSRTQAEALKLMFQKEMNRCETSVMQQVNTIAGLNPKHPEYEGLNKAIRLEIQGNPKLSQWVKWLLMLEYVPSTLMMLAITKRMYDGMEEKKKITPQENNLLMRQEYARQSVGAGLHVGRTLLGFESVVWLMSGLKRHQDVKSLAHEFEHGNQIKQWLAKGLHHTSANMQKSWNLLYSDTNQTIASIGSLMLMNVFTYGITRPLMVNTAFWGFNSDRNVKRYALEHHTTECDAFTKSTASHTEKAKQRFKNPGGGSSPAHGGGWGASYNKHRQNPST